jgi:hypothetical protein
MKGEKISDARKECRIRKASEKKVTKSSRKNDLAGPIGKEGIR